MPCFNALPTEVLRKIIRNIPERPFRTELFLFNKALCNLFMTEQNKSLRLSDRQLRHFITVITNNDVEELYSVPRYCNLLDRTYELDISIDDYDNDSELFLEQVAGLFHRCINLRHLIIKLLTNPPHGSNITAIFGSLSLSIVEIKIISQWDNKKVSQSAFEYIRRKKNLEKLQLQAIRIGDDKAQALSEALKKNSALQQLSLQGNGITVDGVRALVEYLKHNASLTHLNLDSAICDNTGVLHFSGNSIGDDGAQALSEALKYNSTLQQLSLKGNGITVDGVRALAEYLRHNASLTHLNLDNVYFYVNNIGDVGAQALGEALKCNSTLQQLSLEGNHIGNIGAQALSEALKENFTLQQLDLMGNDIGDNGAQALSEALNENSTLRQLNLNGNNIGADGARALEKFQDLGLLISFKEQNMIIQI